MQPPVPNGRGRIPISGVGGQDGHIPACAAHPRPGGRRPQQLSMSLGPFVPGCHCQQVPPNGGEVAAVVTQEFFDGIVNHVDGEFPGKRFYTRSAFLEALTSFPGFGRAGDPDGSKREIAAFFAHVTHETGHLRFVEEICDASRRYWDEKRAGEYPCAAGKSYHGRGPLQLTWNYNYGAAGESIGFDGLGSPETVAEDPVVAFKTALWYWMEKVHPLLAAGGGFGATIRAINGGECGGGSPKAVARRVRFYLEYCQRFGVAPGDNLTC